MGWVRHSQDTKLPGWLKNSLRQTCEYCGSENENYYNEKGECTNRRCPNPTCSGTLARKFGAMADILKWKGVSDRTGFKYITQNKLKTHFEVIPFVFQGKPEANLYELFRVCFIPGVDSGWADVVEGCASVEEVLTKYKGALRQVLLENKDTLLMAEKYFVIQRPMKYECEPLITGNVMISGNIRGLNNRDSLVYGLNESSKGLIQLHVVGKRKTGVMCLIQEADTPNRGKAEVALECGIPIYTPEEFVQRVVKQLKNKLKEAGKK